MTVTYTEWVEAFNYETRPVFNYETREVFHYVTRTRWVCPSGYVLNDSTDPPLCDPDGLVVPCVTALGVLGAGTLTEAGIWGSGCVSVHQGSAQVPYYAFHYSFSLGGAASVSVGVSSSVDAYVYLADSAGVVLFEDDDSGAGADALLDGLSLGAGDYVVEASTAAPRQAGSFALSVAVSGTTAPAGVSIGGFADASGTPVPGGATALVSDRIEVSPSAAVCSAGPLGASVSPERDAATRSVSMDVAAGTAVQVTVECSWGAHSDSARAQFTAHAAPPVVADVEISGLDDVTAAPQPGAGSATVSDEFDVVPADAVCVGYATRGTAAVVPASGTVRTVSLEVAAGTTEYVVVRCTNTDGDRRTAAARFTADPTPTGPPPPSGGCTDDLGALATGTVDRSGTITDDAACRSVRRHSDPSRIYYAQRHTFSLDSAGWVSVDLGSAASNSTALDTYVVLLEGHGPSGAVADYDDDAGPGFDSRLDNVFLAPGDYTVEATTYRRQATGDYTLTVDAVLSGVAERYEATVDEQLTISLASPDVTAEVRSITPSTLAWSAGPAVLALTAGLADTHRVEVKLTNSSGSTRANARAARSATAAVGEAFEFEVVASCAAGLVTSDRNGRLCVTDRAQTSNTTLDEDRITESDRGRKYPVTLGTLWGVKRVAEDARDAYMNPSPGVTRTCTPTANRIAAIMLSIPLWEVPRSWWIDDNGDDERQDDEFYVQRDPGRSPMALSRKDRERALYPPAGSPQRAFWHPGVGLWQLDDPRTDFRRLNHAERAEIHIGGRAVADHLVGALCGVSESAMRDEINMALSPWKACRWNTSQTCYLLSYLNLWVKGTDDLHVTSYSTEYRAYNGTHAGGSPVVRDHRSDYSTSGGLSKLQCRWEGFGDPFGCWFYDTDNPEGWMQDQDKPGIPGDISPLAAPFISFTDGEGNEEKRFAVFPESFLGTTTTLYRAVSVRTDVDLTGAGSWHEDDYGPHDRVLLVRVCSALGPEAGGACRWRSVHASDLARKFRDAGL